MLQADLGLFVYHSGSQSVVLGPLEDPQNLSGSQGGQNSSHTKRVFFPFQSLSFTGVQQNVPESPGCVMTPPF